MVVISNKKLGLVLIILAVVLLILLVSVKFEDDKRDAYLCEAVAADPHMSMDQCPVHTDRTASWVLFLSFGITFLILAGGVYLVFGGSMPPLPAQEMGLPAEALAKLDEEERRVYDLLLLHDGSLYQSDLIRETGMSKVRMTRLLDRMQGKKIVDRRRRGMTNIVVLR